MNRHNKLIDGDVRRSSIFDLQRMQAKDRGSSTISLSDVPSLARKGPRVQYENTYRMDPEKKVNLVQVKEIILGVLEEKFGDVSYNVVDTSLLCKRASQQIKELVKKLDFERYKLVCVVTVSSQERQGIKQASRFLWDDKKDNWIDATYTNASLIANASLYALYCE